MRKVYRKVPFQQFTGYAFDRQKAVEDISGIATPFNKPITLIFEDGAALVRDYSRRVHATVENPTYDFSKKTIEDYMAISVITGLFHESKSHKVVVSEDGRAKFVPLINGEELSNKNNAYYEVLKKKSKVANQAKEWQTLSKELGFRATAPTFVPWEEIKDKECGGVKACIKIMNVNKEDFISYAADTLLTNIYGTNSKLSVNSQTSTLVVEPDAISLNMTEEQVRGNKKDIDFALSMMGDLKEEPIVKYAEDVNTVLDNARSFYNAHEDSIKTGVKIALAPVGAVGIAAFGSSVSGGTIAQITEATEIGGVVGGAVDLAIFGGSYAVRQLRGRTRRKNEEKTDGRYAVAERAASEEHFKEEEGVCFYLTTEKCATALAKEKKKK
jgi:hypothetical protein